VHNRRISQTATICLDNFNELGTESAAIIPKQDLTATFMRIIKVVRNSEIFV
jgi:hypothetical protein